MKLIDIPQIFKGGYYDVETDTGIQCEFKVYLYADYKEHQYSRDTPPEYTLRDYFIKVELNESSEAISYKQQCELEEQLYNEILYNLKNY